MNGSVESIPVDEVIVARTFDNGMETALTVTMVQDGQQATFLLVDQLAWIMASEVLRKLDMNPADDATLDRLHS